MRRLTKAGLIIFVLIVCQPAVFARSWRGITPLHSTVDDVKRLLRLRTITSKESWYYDLPDAIVVITVQNESCNCTYAGIGEGWNVPIGTVTDISVMPKSILTKGRLVIGTDFGHEDASGGLEYFKNTKDGLEVETLNGNVTFINYSAPASESHLRCPKVQNCIADLFPLWDEYGQLAFSDEKEHLDAFAIMLRQSMKRGALVVYGPNPAERKKLMMREQLAKQYLVDTQGIEPQLLIILDGGYREDAVTGLQRYPAGGENYRILLLPEKDPQ